MAFHSGSSWSADRCHTTWFVRQVPQVVVSKAGSLAPISQAFIRRSWESLAESMSVPYGNQSYLVDGYVA